MAAECIILHIWIPGQFDQDSLDSTGVREKGQAQRATQVSRGHKVLHYIRYIVKLTKRVTSKYANGKPNIRQWIQKVFRPWNNTVTIEIVKSTHSLVGHNIVTWPAKIEA